MDWYGGSQQALRNVAKPPKGAFNTKSFGNSGGFNKSSAIGQGSPFQGGRSRIGQGNPFGGSRSSQLGQRGGVMAEWDARANARMDEQFNQQQQGQFGNNAGYNGAGMAAPTGGSFAGGNMDGDSNTINSAAGKFGVPANLLKAVLAKEGSGDWNANKGSVYLASRGERIAGYSGIMESTAKAWGYDFNQLMNSKEMQIEATASGLARLHGQVGAQWGWDGVLATYYSGNPDQSYTPGDSHQYGSTAQYVSQVGGWWKMLDGQSPGQNPYGGQSGGGSSGMSGGMSGMWGNIGTSISQGHGPSEFSRANASWYTYAAGVGVEGHPGIDVTMPDGSALYSPGGGTVLAAGGTGSYRYDRAADGPGRGELRIQLDNGDIVIMGHMSGINVRAGQRINAGQAVGRSGMAGTGDHLHLEVRVKGNTSSGWQAVDPQQYFSGTSFSPQMGSGGQQMGGQPQQRSSGGNWWQQPLNSLFGR